MELSIVNNDNENQDVIIGEVTSSLLSGLKNLEDNEKKTLERESVNLLSKCTSVKVKESSTTGLAIGYVQSGKTLSFTTVTGLAKDNGFRIVIILAGTKNNLLNQTTSRLKEDFHQNIRQFKILQNPNANKDTLLIRRSLKMANKPLILITLLKLGSRIDAVANIFEDEQIQDILGNAPVLIIDDEADQASLNTLERKNAKNNTDDESRTFSSIIGLRDKFINHTFLQYTATPQGPLLIDLMSVLSPDFHVILTPGLKYTGGQTFFRDKIDVLIRRIPENEVYHNRANPLDSPPESLISALKDFYVGAALQLDFVQSQPMFSMMIHPDVRRNASQLFKGWIDEILERWISNFELDDNELIKNEFKSSLTPSIKEGLLAINRPEISLDDIFASVYDCLLDTKTHLVIGNSQSEEIDWSLGCCHILIGGAKLDRGFTVKGLLTTYMPRHSLSISNADTIQQRCRFFGYKQSYLESCRVFLPQNSIDEYISYVEHEEHLREILKVQTTEEFSRTFLLNSRLRPTRNNILRSNLLRRTLNGSKQTNALSHRESNSNLVENLISKFERQMEVHWDYETDDRKHRLVRIPIEEAIQFLLNFKMRSVQDRDLKALTIEYLIYHRDQNSVQTCNLIEMAFEKAEPRERKLVSVDRINNIFSGRSTKNAEVYPGDKAIMLDDSLNIQIYKIKLKNENIPHLHDKIIYTLGFIYPSNLQITLTGIN